VQRLLVEVAKTGDVRQSIPSQLDHAVYESVMGSFEPT
jgi:hypothetical protein